MKPTPDYVAPSLADATSKMASGPVPWCKRTLLQFLVLFGYSSNIAAQASSSVLSSISSTLGSISSSISSLSSELAQLKAAVQLQSSATNAIAVIPHDTNPLPFVTRALIVKTGGSSLTVRFNNGSPVNLGWFPDGTILPIAVTHVTQATDAQLLALG